MLGTASGMILYICRPMDFSWWIFQARFWWLSSLGEFLRYLCQHYRSIIHAPLYRDHKSAARFNFQPFSRVDGAPCLKAMPRVKRSRVRVVHVWHIHFSPQSFRQVPGCWWCHQPRFSIFGQEGGGIRAHLVFQGDTALNSFRAEHPPPHHKQNSYRAKELESLEVQGNSPMKLQAQQERRTISQEAADDVLMVCHISHWLWQICDLAWSTELVKQSQCGGKRGIKKLGMFLEGHWRNGPDPPPPSNA